MYLLRLLSFEEVVMNLEILQRAIVASMLLLLLAAGNLLHAQEPITSVHAVRFNVKSMKRAERFFTEALGFKVIRQSETRTILKLGAEHLEIQRYDPSCVFVLPTDTHSNDLWFQHIAIVVSDMDKAFEHLREHKIEPLSVAPQTLPASNPAAGGIRAYYFRDPEGHALELIWFPQGKGDPRWQRPTKELFLGIDHTAIVVSNTKASLDFYRELGFEPRSYSENYGIEQARLNNVPGAHLRITSLRAHEGIGIEFLEYFNPRNGRRPVADLCIGDVQVPAVVAGSTGKARTVRDPDGHIMLLEAVVDTIS